MRGIVSMVALLAGLGLALAVFMPSTPRAAKANERAVVATIHPLAAILREIAGDHLTVHTLLAPNISPHVFDPKPGDIARAEAALAVFYVDDTLDGWAVRLSPQRVAVFQYVDPGLYVTFNPHADPEEFAAPSAEGEVVPVADDGGHVHGPHCVHEHGAVDPHFWTDPVVVAAIVPQLAEKLADLDPENGDAYRANAQRFVGELADLDEELRATLAPVRGQPVFLFHASLLYLLERYGLVFAGVIEPFPGNSPAPTYLERLTRRFDALQARGLFTEPQLPERTARLIAEELNRPGMQVHMLDPIGGVPGRETYADLVRYNARVLAEALE
jgi:zinc transport system substrate-binding protein